MLSRMPVTLTSLPAWLSILLALVGFTLAWLPVPSGKFTTCRMHFPNTRVIINHLLWGNLPSKLAPLRCNSTKSVSWFCLLRWVVSQVVESPVIVGKSLLQWQHPQVKANHSCKSRSVHQLGEWLASMVELIGQMRYYLAQVRLAHKWE